MLKYVSASQIKTFRRCPRLWVYEKFVRKTKTPSTKAQEFGTNVHEELEEYLTTGAKPKLLSSQALVTDLPYGLLTKGILTEVAVSKYSLLMRPLSKVVLSNYTLAGYPVSGFIDVWTTTGVEDFKTTKDLRYSLKAEELLTDVQMMIYADVFLTAHPTLTECTVTHRNVTRSLRSPKSRVVSVPVSRSHVAEQIEDIEHTVRKMADTLSQYREERNVHLVDDNGRTGCYAYGPCYFLKRGFSSSRINL